MPVRIAKTGDRNDDRRLGMEALNARKWLEAINRLGAVVEIDPADHEALHCIAVAHNALGDPKTARAMLGRAVEAKPDYAPAHKDLAALLLKEGRVLEAADSAIRAVEFNPFDDGYVGLLTQIRAQACRIKPSGKKGKKHRQGSGPAQSQIDASLSRMGSTLRHAASVRSDTAGSGDGPTISLCMIARNEERFIGDCLESVKGLVDEVIVLDTGSTDRTVEIAESLGAKVIRSEWPGSYADARNESLSHAGSDWILVLDADERLDKDSRAPIRHAVRQNACDMYGLTFRNYLSEDGSQYFVHRACRLFRNRPEYRFTGRVHEHVVSSEIGGGKVGEVAALIHHHGYRPELVEERGKFDRNVQLLLADLKDNPNDPFCLYNLGAEYSRHGSYDQSKPYLSAAADLVGPEHEFAPNVFVRLAEAHQETGDFESALEALNKAREKGIAHPELYYTRGSLYLRQKFCNEALKEFESAIRLGSQGAWTGDPGAYGHKAFFGIAQAYMELGARQQTVDACQMALARNPNDPEVHALLAAAYMAMDRRRDAEKHLAKASGMTSGSAESLIILGDALKQSKRYKDAASRYSEALAAGADTADLRFKLGVCMQASGDLSGAEDQYKRALDKKPAYPQALTAMGYLHAQQNRLDDAMQSFASAVDADPSYTEAYFSAGDVLCTAGRFADAANVYQSGLSHDASNARGFFSLGNCYLRMGAPDAAVIAYRQVLALKPDFAEARRNLAQAEQASALPKAA